MWGHLFHVYTYSSKLTRSMALFAYQRYFVGKDDSNNSFCPISSAFDYWIKMTSSPIRYGISYKEYHGPEMGSIVFDFIDYTYYEVLTLRICYILFYIFIGFAILNVVICRQVFKKLKGVLIYHLTESLLDIISPALLLLCDEMFIALLWNDINHPKCQESPYPDAYNSSFWRELLYVKEYHVDICTQKKHLMAMSLAYNDTISASYIDLYTCKYTKCETRRINAVLYPAKAILSLLTK